MGKLVLNRVEKRYGDLKVVDALSLSLAEGELLTLLGPSGCGKTTTLRMIAGFVDLSAGSIAIDGAEMSNATRTVAPEHRGMSMIFQSYAIWPHMTVFDNVAFGLTVRRTPAAERRERVLQMLDVVKLSHLAQRYPAELSGGQQQRVALARAMVVRPAVLLLDEPLSNLDANLREEMASEIRRLHDEFKFTTVYVTHDQAEAMAISDRIAVLNQGRLEQIDTPWNLYNRPRTTFVASFIGQTNLLSGQVHAGQLILPGFQQAVPLPQARQSESRPTQVSIRPQSLRLGPPLDASQGESVTLGPVVVLSRTYLGEHWHYLVRPLGGSEPLKVHAAPTQRLDIGQESTLSIDPSGLALLN